MNLLDHLKNGVKVSSASRNWLIKSTEDTHGIEGTCFFYNHEIPKHVVIRDVPEDVELLRKKASMPSYHRSENEFMLYQELYDLIQKSI